MQSMSILVKLQTFTSNKLIKLVTEEIICNKVLDF